MRGRPPCAVCYAGCVPRHPLLPLLRIGAALGLGGALLYSPRRVVHFRPLEPAVWATDVAPSAPEWLQVGLRASGPLPGQKHPPCTPVRERELVGACWIGTEHTPPCPEAIHEVAGRCVVPVQAAKRPDTSISR